VQRVSRGSCESRQQQGPPQLRMLATSTVKVISYAMEVSEEFRLRQMPYEHPDVALLEAATQQFYVQIYGSPDETPFTTADFSPPRGAFFVGYLNDAPVAMGGWRFRPPGVPPVAQRPAEIRRMFVDERVRGQGLGRIVLAALEASAAAAGADWMLFGDWASAGCCGVPLSVERLRRRRAIRVLRGLGTGAEPGPPPAVTGAMSASRTSDHERDVSQPHQ
jgi:GNAT superfamily N-acetyltransferase